MATTTRKKTPARTAPVPARKRVAPAKAAAADAAPAAPAKAVKAAKPAKSAKPVKADKDKADKARKPKLVRDSFTIPKVEYAVIETLKQRAQQAGRPAKKSELLRAGLKVLAEMGDAGFSAALAAVPAVKTGRPAKA